LTGQSLHLLKNKFIKFWKVSNIERWLGKPECHSHLGSRHSSVDVDFAACMSSVAPPSDHSTEPSLYNKAELIGLRRTMLLYCRSFPPGKERNHHRQVALSIRRLFNNAKWMDIHTVEASSRRSDASNL
jgi:hypothetical protein